MGSVGRVVVVEAIRGGRLMGAGRENERGRRSWSSGRYRLREKTGLSRKLGESEVLVVWDIPG